MTDYQLVPDAPFAGAVVRLADRQMVSPDSEGWPAYQDWLAAGNTPEAAPVAAKPTVISAGAFFARFTDAERAAIWPASVANAQLGVGLVNGLANGSVNLLAPEAQAWLDGLVAAGALTADRATEILTP